MEELRRFGLEDELPINDHIECLPGKRLSSIVDHDRDFAIDPMALSDQLSFQSERVNVFPKSEPELAMNVIESADDGTRERLLEHRPLAFRTRTPLSVPSAQRISSNCDDPH
jgi:hypothetical protein